MDTLRFLLLLCAVGILVVPVDGFHAFTSVCSGGTPSLSRGPSQGMQMFFGGNPTAFPKLFDGWFKKNGQIEKGMIAGCKASGLKVGEPLEVLFPPVPNLDEVNFGTPLNAQFGTEMAVELGLPPYKPGSSAKRYLLQWASVYWAKKLGQGLGGKVWAVCGDGLKKDIVSKPGSINFASMAKPDTWKDIKKGDTVLVVSPGTSQQWRMAEEAFKDNKVVFLNGLVSDTYDLGGPLPSLRQAYYVKRISKGWAFKAGKQPWKGLLEKPDGTVELVQSYPERPSLSELATGVRELSMARYGMNNDRFMKGFGERL